MTATEPQNSRKILTRKGNLVPAGLLALLALIVLFVDLGGPGLWDPWEMNPAHLARVAASKPSVYVVGGRDDAGLGEHVDAAFAPHGGAAFNWLSDRRSAVDRAPKRAFDRARPEVTRRGYHAVIVRAPPAAKVRADDATASWRSFASTVAEKLPGTPIVLVGEHAEESAELMHVEGVNVKVASDADALAALAAHIAGLPSRLLRVTTEDGVYGVAPLRYWLAAASYRAFGFDEQATRLPGAILGLLTVGIAFVITTWLSGPWTGLLAGAVLLGTSYLPVQARSLAGEMGFVAWLSVGVLGLGWALRGRSAIGLAAFGVSFVLLFLEKGLYGAACLALIPLALALVESSVRARMLTLSGIAWVAWIALAAAVWGPDDWSFLAHFRAMNRPFEGGPGAADRSFDFFMLQVGFGLMPWIVLVPFALSDFVVKLASSEPGERALRALVVLWAAVPFVFLAATVLRFAHCVYPAGPALAVAIAVFATSLRDEPRPWPLRALFVVLALALMMSELKLSPHPLVGTITWDPPFVFAFKEIHHGVLYPDIVRAPSFSRAFGYLFALALIYCGLRGADRLDALRRASSRPRVFFGVLFAIAAAFALDLTCSLGLRIQSLVVTSAGAIGKGNIAKINGLVWSRPEHWLLYLSMMWCLVGAIVDTPFVTTALRRKDLIVARAGRWMLRKVGIRLRRLEPQQRGELGFPLTEPALRAPDGVRLDALLDLVRPILATGAGVWLAILAWQLDPAALTAAATDPLAIAGVLLVVALSIRSRREGENGRTLFVYALAAGVLYIGVRSARFVGLTSPDVWLLELVPAALLFFRFAPRLRDEPHRARAFFGALIVLTTLAILAPLGILHESIVPKARLPDAVGYLTRLGASSPDIFAIGIMLALWAGMGWARALRGVEARHGRAKVHASILMVSVLAAALLALLPTLGAPAGAAELLAALAWTPFLAVLVDLVGVLMARWSGAVAVVGWFFRMLRHAESPVVVVPGLAVIGLLISGMTVFRFVPELSYHVSQKHILDTYREAARPGAEPDPIFRHGRFESSGGSSSNFYIHSIPEISSQATVLDLLAARKDTVVRVSDSPFHEGPEEVVFRAFDDVNDTDGDKKRDHEAATGLSAKVDRESLVDPDAKWTPDQWKGGVLLDPTGKKHTVLSNTATELRFDSPPFRTKSTLPSGYYRVYAAGASAHSATAMSPSRAFVVLAKNRFSTLNFAFRRKFGGRQIPVIDDRSSRLVLVSSWLDEGEENHNWLARHLLKPEDLGKVERYTKSRVAFDDKLILEGASVSEDIVRRGSTVKVTFYFRVEAGVARSYKVFVHVDRPGTSHRIGADHWVLNLPGHENQKTCVGCFKTNEWLKGDVVADAFDLEVPLATPSGPNHIWMGLYEPNSGMRLRVTDFDKEAVEHDGGNRVRVAVMTVL